MTQAILLIRGLPGSGKSTIARALAASTGAVHCEADDYFINRRQHVCAEVGDARIPR